MHVEKLTSLTLFDAYPHIAVSGQRILIPSDNVMTLVWDTLIWRTNLISRLSYDFGQFLYYYDYFGSCSLLGYHVKCFWVAAPSFGGVSVIINNQTHPHLLCRLKSARLLPQSNTMRRYFVRQGKRLYRLAQNMWRNLTKICRWGRIFFVKCERQKALESCKSVINIICLTYADVSITELRYALHCVNMTKI